MQFMLRVEVADRTGEFGGGTRDADDAAALDAAVPVAAPNGVALDWADPWSAVLAAMAGTATRPDAGHPASAWHWIERIVPRDAALPPPLRCGPAASPWRGRSPWRPLRIAAWRPRLAA